MTQSPSVAVIVPLLNEIKALPNLLAALAHLDAQELILVDGGSTDGSREWLIENQSDDFRVLHCEAGRALQMNEAATHANADSLLFLHADTILPEGALQEATRADWGRFDVEFHDNINPQSTLLSLVARMINIRSRISGIATGDQAIFVRRHLFNQLGGFQLIPIMEDVDLSIRLRAKSKPLCSRLKVRTSARRWRKNGIWRTIFLMWFLRLAYFFGVSTLRLHRIYQHVR